MPVPRDVELITQLITGHARWVRDDVRRHSEDPDLRCEVLDQLAALADDVDRHLAVDAPDRGTLEHTQSRARLLLSLYEGLDLAQRELTARAPVTGVRAKSRTPDCGMRDSGCERLLVVDDVPEVAAPSART
ncbi:hypothetical protein [Streptomyces candidus]|uniref:Uncharacterized protein n=1 Tax=Streptomyces candidus TaxID=67283 RepID=A0A7X0HL79_9ACTN|nr:hypothetical protein [Streptomyces candidus]MBB6439533.1 hypothetical protein [Streptomyces candidus]